MAEHRWDRAVPVPESDEELLAQCRVETFRSGGKGGQHQNVTDSGVRLTHVPSGLVATGRRFRSQLRNKRAALRTLRRKLRSARERPKQRIPTGVPPRARARRLRAKRHRAARKELRKRPTDDVA